MKRGIYIFLYRLTIIEFLLDLVLNLLLENKELLINKLLSSRNFLKKISKAKIWKENKHEMVRYYYCDSSKDSLGDLQLMNKKNYKRFDLYGFADIMTIFQK